MKVIEILPRLKANKYTYYNLSKQDKEIFKTQYNYLKKHKNKTIYTYCLDEINKYLNRKDSDYLNKIKSIQVLSMNINHTDF